ncbi:MAG: hypothetical protein E7306_10705 [Butyrivibrio sp.]|nr:hypothetical protein [Butyrivibrio sp.]
MAISSKQSIDMTYISIPDFPIEINYGDWVIDHPECDSIMEMIGTGPIMLVYAYSTSNEGNKELRLLKDARFSDKKILMGSQRMESVGSFSTTKAGKSYA